jgi:hypothetical protein
MQLLSVAPLEHRISTTLGYRFQGLIDRLSGNSSDVLLIGRSQGVLSHQVNHVRVPLSQSRNSIRRFRRKRNPVIWNVLRLQEFPAVHLSSLTATE